MSNLWQRFVRATALLFGLAVGVGATVFAYSNTQKIDVGWSVFQLRGVPLWAVVIVPLILVLAAATLYHWLNSLHHFSEHMRHRRRVRELEAEVKSLRAHLDSALEMPDGSATETATPAPAPEPEPAALPEPIAMLASNGDDKSAKKPRKKAAAVVEDTEPVAVAPTSDATEAEPREETPAEA